VEQAKNQPATQPTVPSERFSERVPLGATDLRVSPLGIGTWAWGDRLVWGYGGGGFSDDDLRQAYRFTLDSGVNFFDTAELYGFPSHRSEKLLGEFSEAYRGDAVIATKWFPLPWRFLKGQVISALKGSVRRLRVKQVDLYQIHWPTAFISIPRLMEGLADGVQMGLTRAVGVSNYSTAQMRQAHSVLAKRGVPLASNQVEYSLLTRDPERNGLLAACRELNITLIAYSPLAMGILTGKYTPENPPSGVRSRMYNSDYLAKVQPLIALMREIGAAHDDKTPAQVALNWTICKGAIPIPGAKNIKQAQDNFGALGWRLTEAEVAAFDEASAGIGR
jgi:aryl-alcohol dehydrogenase-like predicted oxidoreductase